MVWLKRIILGPDLHEIECDLDRRLANRCAGRRTRPENASAQRCRSKDTSGVAADEEITEEIDSEK